MTVYAYNYGSFNLNNQSPTGGYFLTSKNLDFAQVKPTLQKIARADGMKETGSNIDERTIQCKVLVIGASRVDLENKIDALYQALALRQQPLTLHATDNRYFVADCTDAKTTYSGNVPIAAEVNIVFLCTNPYAVSASLSTYDTGTVTLSGSGPYTTSFSTNSTGTAVALPTIRVYLENSASLSQLTVSETTDARSIVVASNLPQSSGDYIDIYCDPNQIPSNGYSVQRNGSTSCAFNGTFPVLQTYQTTFTLTASTSSGNTPQLRTVLSWYARYMG